MALTANSVSVPSIQPSSSSIQSINSCIPPLQSTGTNTDSTQPLTEAQGELDREEVVIHDLETGEEDDLSEEQLRQLYDDEEIDRFLHLFSAVRCFCPSRCCR
jgi:GRAM domain-containing protein 4